MTSRRHLFDPTDPSGLGPEQRLGEVAAILAAGVIRMRARGRKVAACTPEILPESSEIRLEVSRRSGPDGQCG